MKRMAVTVLFALISAVHLNAHDTFLKFESHYLQPQTNVTLALMNGTIEESENSVAVDRLQDVRVVGANNFVEMQNNNQWKLTDKLGTLSLNTGETGTYVAGVSIKPRKLEMSADDFNKYLKHSGVLDILEARQKNRQTERNVIEKYSKHVKAVYQVGEKRTDSFRQEFKYPIEIIPQQNPCSLNIGDTLPVKVCFKGKPVSNQLVYASYVGFHKHDDEGSHVEAVQTRTDAQGMAQVKISKKGIWYIRLIHMVTSEEKGVDYESNWATITFEVK